jgi:hypothetical protein
MIIMKHVLAIMALVTVFASAAAPARAQVSVNVNIGVQPLWGPVGYDVVEYYYLPDVQAYYYVPNRQFIYLQGNHWVFTNSLPPRYRGYNLYNGYKVVINDPKPYLHFADHRVKYGKYKGWKNKQVIIRDSRDPKYFVVKGHPGNGNNKIKVKDGGPHPGGGPGKGHGGGHGKGKKG